uniref:Uncharacterized protein n=1 Tax=Arundo donax TaxID=35708 RepID=A0A0A9DZ02_ARUDO
MKTLGSPWISIVLSLIQQMVGGGEVQMNSSSTGRRTGENWHFQLLGRLIILLQRFY